MPPSPGRSSQTVLGSSSSSTSISPTIVPSDLGDELDARTLVVLLLTLDGVVIGRVEKREHTALDPAALVGVGVGPDDRVCHRV